MKKIASSLVAGALLLTLTAGAVSADSTVHTLPTVPPASSAVITPFGANAPGSSASSHDLTASNYNYQVSEVGAQVYTDKWLTGSTTMSVSVTNVKNVGETPGNLNGVNVAIFNSSNKQVAIKNIDLSKSTSGSVSFSGLTSSSKYYVEFSVPRSGLKFSFNGTISK
ncbi:hypothetical protein DC345_30215 [Paenibacillus taichungensis]|uniref:Uncharacterized protein n=1 Tax=Paenibacillus taichungensis TaxID=484184 RepID=A0A329QHC7_9BACL|nr:MULTISPECIES: hypothetical protein [Paenibacillus]MCZ1265398.1 hypothetical protein [Paenibacillus tundrae]RAW09738.1 hypothetical protein DC345_30215 [Paenibacillus taichungensis]